MLRINQMLNMFAGKLTTQLLRISVFQVQTVYYVSVKKHQFILVRQFTQGLATTDFHGLKPSIIYTSLG